MPQSRKKTIQIGVAGGKGSFSEEAARAYASRHADMRPALLYLVSVKNVLSALEKGDIDKGIFPVENSNGGIVYEALYAMAEHNFTIKQIFEIDVQHCLLVKKGISASAIKKIVSHDQALKQCRMYLKRTWPKVKIAEYRDTAEAAKDLGRGILPSTVAVIAPRSCAKLYGLEVLEEAIQDLKFNFTTFVVAQKPHII